MFRILTLVSAVAVFALAFPAPALAYIGPGMGVGAIAAVFGVLAAVAMAFAALLFYPVKRLIARLRKPRAAGKSP